MSPEFVRQLLRKKVLPGVRFGRCWRIDSNAVRAYIDGNTVPIGPLPPHPAVLRVATPRV